MSRLFTFSKLHLLETEPKDFFIKDPVHHEINFTKDEFWLYRMVNSYEFQRLGKICQLSFTRQNFPSSIHTRLIHSLGVYEICNRFIRHFVDRGDLSRDKNSKEINIALAAALLHDIGHGPLSHAFEKAVSNFKHEKMTMSILRSKITKVNLILREKAKEDGLDEEFYIDEIEKVLLHDCIDEKSEYLWIVDLISSGMDIDRLDFLIRDSYFSGVSYGKTIDLSLLIKRSMLQKDEDGNRRFCLEGKAKNQVGEFLLARYHMYEDLYWNKAALLYEKALRNLCRYIEENIEFFRGVEGFSEFSFMFEKSCEEWDVEQFLNLYDNKFLEFLERMTDQDKPELKEFKALLFGWDNKKGMSDCTFEPNEIDKLEKDILLWNASEQKIEKFTFNIAAIDDLCKIS